MMIVHLRRQLVPLGFLRQIPTIAAAAVDLLRMSAPVVVNEGGTWHVYNALIAHENSDKILRMLGGARRINGYTATIARVEFLSP
jgi:hypothetical protein